ncbi:GH3 auxin-responsive promoter family protein [Shimia abyssi]|uniref:GH3 auxin-responsive promoter n=1 Tax=Shimia abyssi TaxID=1662395 RepID=A0A2P8FFQ2_9RHOB|nr:GH3 auxin-responsive promoter family protein [Shimia abyssi]PSL20543.1 GH3 auxin-responsive promoter [Shimia abyssi]
MVPNLSALLARAAVFHSTRFDKVTHHVRQTQTACLQDILRYSGNGAIARDLRVSERTPEDVFRREVPVQSYAAFAPYAERIANGEKNVVSKEDVLFMATSSGTTGTRKLLPITKTVHRVRQRARMASAGYLVRGLTKRHLPHGRIMITSSAAMMGETSGGIPFGFTSACVHNMNRSKYSARIVTPYPFDVMAIPGVRERHIMSFLFALRDPKLRFIAGNFPPFLLHIAAQLNEEAPMLIEALRTGGVPDGVVLNERTHRKLAKSLRADPQRAEVLARIFERDGRLDPGSVWPGLTALFTSLGDASTPYLPSIKKVFGDKPLFGGLYSATESVFGVNTEIDDGSSTLAIGSAYFEFVPRDQWDQECPESVLPHEVEVGQEYRIIVTNYHGLMRYDIGDIVRITGWHNTTPKLTFLRRRGGALNATHEMTTEADIDLALRDVEVRLGCAFHQVGVTLRTNLNGMSRYFWLVEFAGSAPDLNILAASLDAALSRSNLAYAERRKDYIPEPVVALLPTGTLRSLKRGDPGKLTDAALKGHRILYGNPAVEGLSSKAIATSTGYFPAQ